MKEIISTEEILKRAKTASREMGAASPEVIDCALLKMAEALLSEKEKILAANRLDCLEAKKSVSSVMLDRLYLDEKRIEAMAKGIREIAALPSPLGKSLGCYERADGLIIEKRSVPLGVVAIIYESRPNVTSDAAALAVKSGNACILRSGKEAHSTSLAITEALQKGASLGGLCENAVQLVADTSRESAMALMRARGYIDLLIPRGGKGLISACVENATVPCIETGTGICHIYADRSADISMALNIIDNAKTSRPSVCNAAEVLLVHKDIAYRLLPLLRDRLTAQREAKGLVPVELRLDGKAREIIDGRTADDTDFDTEFLDYILAVKIVDGIDEAIEHISRHSTKHSECIITEDGVARDLFFQRVDAAAVYHNASTRFTDGGEFGLGCEMGISTQKLHARGPMGISELTTYKYLIVGNGQVR